MIGSRLLNVVASVFLLGGCASTATVAVSNSFSAVAPPPNPQVAAAPGDYRLSTGDLIDISVFQVPDLSKEVLIDASGRISLPLIGDLTAAGSTTHDLETAIAKKLKAKYLQSPQVSVFLKTSAGQQVTIDGAVKTPGVYPITGQLTLLQGLARAGDLDFVGDPSSIVVFRQSGGQRLAAKFNLDDIRAGVTADPALQAGDTIIVGSSSSRALLQNVESVIPVAGLFTPFAGRIP